MKIAFLGLGQMGRRMVVHLIDAGHEVMLWNRSAKVAQGFEGRAQIAKTPQEAVKNAEVILTMLSDDDASRAVWAHILEAAPSGALGVEMSTLSLARTGELARDAAAKGLEFFEAPVAGSLPQAEAAQLIFLLGADQPTRFDALANSMGGRIVYAGSQGQGMALKLAVNTLLAVQTVAAADLVAYAKSAGFTSEKIAELLGGLPVSSPAMQGVLSLIAKGQHSPMFPIDLAAKDLRYFMTESDSKLVESTLQTFSDAQAKGHGDKHITAVAL